MSPVEAASTEAVPRGRVIPQPGLVALLVAMLIWGGTYVVTSSALGAVGPFTILVLRLTIAFLVLLLFARRRGYRLSMSASKTFIVFGFTGMTLHLGLENLGLVFTSASTAALVVASAPAIVAIFSIVMLKERLGLLRAIGIAASIVGVLLVTGAGTGGDGSHDLVGALFVLGGVTAWGLFTVQGKRLSTGHPAIVSTTAATGAAVAMSIPLAVGEILIQGTPAVGGAEVLAIFYLGLGASAGAYLLWNYALAHVDATVAGVSVNLVPVIAVTLALLIGETLTTTQWIGGAIVGAGVWLTQKGARPAPSISFFPMAQVQGTVEEIYITERGSAPMERVEQVEAVAGKGLLGDRYMLGTGYWSNSKYDLCQVTLIAAEDVEAVARESELEITAGQHRRNIITRGIVLSELEGRTFKVGDALFEYDQPRPPCRYLQTITQPGMTKALGDGRAGICCRILESGLIRPGDQIVGI